MHDDRQEGDTVPAGSNAPKREYRRPELRELGTLTEVTQATPNGSPSNDSEYHTS